MLLICGIIYHRNLYGSVMSPVRYVNLATVVGEQFQTSSLVSGKPDFLTAPLDPPTFRNFTYLNPCFLRHSCTP